MHAATAPGTFVEDARGESVAPARSFEQFVAEHQDTLRRHARLLCRGNYDADDLVQEVLLRAFRGYGGVRDASRAQGWLLRILSTTFIDFVRKQRGEPVKEPIEGLDVSEAPPEPLPASASVTKEQLLAEVEKLPKDERDCYRMHALEGRDYNYIAAKQGVPKATVGTRLLRARRRLKKLLRAHVDSENEP